MPNSLKTAVIQRVRTNPRLGRLALKCIPDVRWNIQIRSIGQFQIRLRRNRSFWLRDPLSHEAFMFGALRRLIRPGDVVYDVGCNIGMYLRFMLNSFQAGQVIGFEPMAENFELLRTNIGLGCVSAAARVFPIALGDTDTHDTLQVDDVSSASAVLSSVSHGHPCESRQQYGFGPLTQEVTVTRLDTFIEQEKVSPPHVMKVDVEGAEPLVLRGAQRVLTQFQPRLAIELHGIEKARQVVEILTNCGYTVAGYIRLDGATTYKQIDGSDLERLMDPYDLHHLVASVNPHDVAERIEMYQP